MRDEKGASVKQTGNDSWEISFSGKNDSGSIILDKHITATRIIDVLLENLQYILLLYDKGIIQAEYEISNDKIVKERLVFMKKHNKFGTSKKLKHVKQKIKIGLWRKKESRLCLELIMLQMIILKATCSHSFNIIQS